MFRAETAGYTVAVVAPGYDNITELLNDAAQSDTASIKELLQVVYPELRRLAASAMRAEMHNQTLQTTALVHEAFLRLFRGKIPSWNNQLHFFSSAARQMRLVLVDHARRRMACKRGGGKRPLTVDVSFMAAPAIFERTLILNNALDRLSAVDARAAQIVEMRFFAGLAHEEIASALRLHQRTVESDWQFARAWLRRTLAE
jgi:RNA polymerase sigma factor (TIGR02999 family)